MIKPHDQIAERNSSFWLMVAMVGRLSSRQQAAGMAWRQEAESTHASYRPEAQNVDWTWTETVYPPSLLY